MGTIWAIGKREFASFFNSAIAYFAITIFLFALGALFFWQEEFIEQGQATMRPFFEWAPWLFIGLLPAISMRLIAEEKRTGSLEMLITMPIRDIELMLGKLLGSVLFLMVTLALTLAYPLAIRAYGSLDMGPVVGGYVGLLLVGTAFLALGLMASSWTRNQIVAFLLGAMLCGLLYGLDKLIGVFSESWRDAIATLSMRDHFETIAKGVLDTRGIVYYLSITVLSVVVGTYSLESRRWT